MSVNSVSHYLHNYAEPVVDWLDANIRRQLYKIYRYVLVIPVYDESLDCLDYVLPQNLQNTLVIIVVNASEDDNIETIKRSQALLNRLGGREAPLTVINQNKDTTLLVIDCCTKNRLLPLKQGVGLARKIGADLALLCIANKIVVTPWIHCTDADVKLPNSYFDNPELEEDVAVAIYPFTHYPPHKNILLYEISLRYYKLHLAWAGSPYAFHTIGSLLKINAQNYAAVRGFPKRQAAEDFYLLNKLAKTGKVIQLKTEPIILSSRISTRVPFGTGAMMKRLANNQELLFYHREIFNYLRIWLDLIEMLWCDRYIIKELGLAQWLIDKELADEILLTILLQLGVDKILQHAYRQCKDYSRFKFFIKVWFDGFRTLKFIHYLRDNYFPSLPLEEAIILSNKLSNSWQFPESGETLTTLQFLNQILSWKENQL